MTKVPPRLGRSSAAIFAVPVAIALVSLLGLVSALAGDGLADAVSWVALAIPIATIAWALHARRS